MAPPQCIAASVAIGNFLQGWDSAAIAGAILYITKEFDLDATTTGLLVAISIIGGLSTTLMAGVFADTFGRRKILFVAGILYLLSALAMALSPTVYILIIARFLVGCAYGLSATVVPLLISETAPSDIRGQLATFPQLTNSLGTFTGYCVVFLLSLRATASWRLMTAALGAPSFVYISLCILYLPESPRWLVRKGRMNEAKQTLQRLLNKEDVTDDLALVVEGLGTGKDVTIEEYVVEHAEAITGNEQQKQDGEKIHLYGLEEDWIAKPASCVESAPINSHRLIDSTVALIESFQQIPVFENIDPIDEVHESSQWDVENQDHEGQTDSEEDEETPSVLEESVPNTPLFDHEWGGLDRLGSNQADSLRTPLLSQNNSSYAERKSARGKVNWSTEFLNNLQSSGNVKNSSKNSGHLKFPMNGSLPEQSMGLGGGWQVAYQLQQSESNQSASLKRVFMYAGSASNIPSAVGSIRSIKSLPGLEGRESMQVSALVGEPALSLTQNDYGPSSETVVGPAIMHPSQISTKGIRWSDFCDVRVRRALSVGMTLQLLQQFCGISAVLFYTPSILKEAKVDEVLSHMINIDKNSAALLASAISAMPMLVFILLGMWLMDRAGRRAILLYTTPILFLTMLIMSLTKAIHLASAVQSLVLIGCIMAFLSFFNMGFGAIPNIVCSEIFPTNVRGACLGICGLTLFLWCTIVTLSFPALNNFFGAPAVFGFFAVMSLISWVFTYLKVPETKGIPLEIITEFFAVKKQGVNEENRN